MASVLRYGAMGIAVVALSGFVMNAGAADPGKAVYEQTCIACHGADGKGVLPGVPDFTETGGRLSQPESVLVKNVIEGFQSPGSPMAMPANGGNAALTKADAEAVVKYLIGAFAAR